MQLMNKLDAFGRIISAIKTYRFQTGDYRDLAYNELANAYLEQHLSAQDWLFWQQAQDSNYAGRPDLK